MTTSVDDDQRRRDWLDRQELLGMSEELYWALSVITMDDDVTADTLLADVFSSQARDVLVETLLTYDLIRIERTPFGPRLRPALPMEYA